LEIIVLGLTTLEQLGVKMADEKDTKLEEKAKAAITAAQNEYHDHNHLAKSLLIVLGAFLILVVIAGGTMAAFRLFNRGRVVGAVENRGMMNFGGFRGGMMGGYRLGIGQEDDNVLTGTVKTVNGSKFTVDVNGTTKTVEISSDTRFPVNSATKVAVNDKVVVIGEQDSNGVIQATRIVVNPSYLN
jgi:hypothetical protein